MTTRYPSYSVYILRGGLLIHYGSRRREIDDLEKAKHVAANTFNTYKGAYDVLVLKYTAPYESTIVHLISRDKND